MVEDYIYLCKLFGGCYDLVQTNGGNISVKTDNRIIIKKSGFKMLNTEVNKGYVICDIDKIKYEMNLNNENIQNTIIEGELNATPSIETFFHLIPKKYVVHIHPTYLLYFLCLKGWKEELEHFNFNFNYMMINYYKPGIELSNKIFEHYNSENVIFLQNHGVILCDDNIENIIKYISEINYKILSILPNINCTNITFLKELYTILPNKYIKSVYIQNISHDRYFYKLSPDLFLYLGEYPIVVESSEVNIENEINKYIFRYNKSPNIIISNNIIYCISNTYDNVKNLEEMIQTYYQLITLNLNAPFNEINNPNDLENWDKEKLRLK